MKYKAIIETDDIDDFEFFEDGNGKYLHGIDAGSVNGEWIALYFTECEQEPCEDYISRQAVLDAMYALCNTGETLKENPWRDNPHIDAITDAINDLPSVIPQPRTGHWIKKGNTLICPICGAVGEDIKSDYCFNYCPNCGAKMIELQDSEAKK